MENKSNEMDLKEVANLPSVDILEVIEKGIAGGTIGLVYLHNAEKDRTDLVIVGVEDGQLFPLAVLIRAEEVPNYTYPKDNEKE